MLHHREHALFATSSQTGRVWSGWERRITDLVFSRAFLGEMDRLSGTFPEVVPHQQNVRLVPDGARNRTSLIIISGTFI